MRALLAAIAVSILPALAGAAPISVVLLGDSITVGDSSQPVGPGYATLLAESLAGFDVANVACSGSSSPQWTRSSAASICFPHGIPEPNLYLARAHPLLPADLVTILLGTNDAVGAFLPGPVTTQQYRDAIETIALELLADGAGQVMLMTPPNAYGTGLAQQLRLFGYRSEILALCSAPGDAILCGPDVFTLLQPEDFQPGDLHPNAQGHRKLSDALHAAIVAAVPEPGTGSLLLAGLAWLTARARARTVPARVRKTG